MYPTFGGSSFYGSYNFGLYGALVTYGSLSLTESSPPQSLSEPLTMREVKDYLRLPQERSPADNDEDDTLSSFISAAREQAEIRQRQSLVRKQYDLAFDYWTRYAIELLPPLASVELVQYKDSGGAMTSLVENTDYIVDTNKRPGIITPGYNTTWPTFTPWPSSSILIRFTSGYSAGSVFWSDSGARVKIGMKQLISLWFNKRLPFDNDIVLDPVLDHLLSYGSVPSVR